MAIVLDGSIPDSDPDALPGQASHSRLLSRRKRHSSESATRADRHFFVGNVATDSMLPAPLAGTESVAPPANEARNLGTAASFNPRPVMDSFKRIVTVGPAAMEYFYARLFTVNPRITGPFPDEHGSAARPPIRRARPARLEPGQSAAPRRDPVPPGPRAPPVRRHGGALRGVRLDAARHGRALHRQRLDCRDSRGVAGRARLRGRNHAGRGGRRTRKQLPPWWVAEIVSHELRSPGVAVLRLRPSQPLPYQAGQYVPVQVTKWPRIWRPYSIADRATARRPHRTARQGGPWRHGQHHAGIRLRRRRLRAARPGRRQR